MSDVVIVRERELKRETWSYWYDHRLLTVGEYVLETRATKRHRWNRTREWSRYIGNAREKKPRVPAELAPMIDCIELEIRRHAEAQTKNAALAKEIARYRTALRALVDALPKCAVCAAPATAGEDDCYITPSACDQHSDTETATNGYADDVDARYAEPLRAAIAILADEGKR